jgi:hypothetical protein
MVTKMDRTRWTVSDGEQVPAPPAPVSYEQSSGQTTIETIKYRREPRTGVTLVDEATTVDGERSSV